MLSSQTIPPHQGQPQSHLLTKTNRERLIRQVALTVHPENKTNLTQSLAQTISPWLFANLNSIRPPLRINPRQPHPQNNDI